MDGLAVAYTCGFDLQRNDQTVLRANFRGCIEAKFQTIILVPASVIILNA